MKKFNTIYLMQQVYWICVAIIRALIKSNWIKSSTELSWTDFDRFMDLIVCTDRDWCEKVFAESHPQTYNRRDYSIMFLDSLEYSNLHCSPIFQYSFKKCNKNKLEYKLKNLTLIHSQKFYHLHRKYKSCCPFLLNDVRNVDLQDCLVNTTAGSCIQQPYQLYLPHHIRRSK